MYYSFNRRNEQEELNDDKLSRLAPSIFADNHKADLSGKYRQVKTIEIINTMRGIGWYPVKAEEVHTRVEGRQGYQKHMIQFAKKEGLGFLEIGNGIFPRAILTNSHDGLCSYTLMAGLWRQICSNGLVVASQTFEEIRIRHVGFEPSMLIQASCQVMESMPILAGSIESYQKIELTDQERNIYARAALVAKHDDMPEEQQAKLLPDLALRIRRNDDTKKDLWTTYNVVQENLVKGGRREIAGKNRAREIKSIDKNIQLNRALWTLTSEMAKLKTA